MYLSTKEHDKLRTIVMGFEIPFRTYIAQKITLSYPDASSFFSAIDQITLPDNASQELKSKYGQMKSQFAYYYQLFEMTIQSSIIRLLKMILMFQMSERLFLQLKFLNRFFMIILVVFPTTTPL